MLPRIMRAIALFRTLPLILFMSVLSSCDEGNSQTENSEAFGTGAIGFEAVIKGAYEGEVAGSGVLKFLPEAGFDKRGYYFLSDGQGIRPHGVTFVLPRGLAPGQHALTSPLPMEVGTVPSVRVDSDIGNAVLSSEKNTTGTLDVQAFPKDENSLNRTKVAGTFQFETEDPQGRRIAVTGTFSFTAE